MYVPYVPEYESDVTPFADVDVNPVTLAPLVTMNVPPSCPVACFPARQTLLSIAYSTSCTYTCPSAHDAGHDTETDIPSLASALSSGSWSSTSCPHVNAMGTTSNVTRSWNMRSGVDEVACNASALQSGALSLLECTGALATFLTTRRPSDQSLYT